MSFNYPNNPTKFQKNKYKKFITDLQYTLPCKYCRMNLTKNFKSLPIKDKHLNNRLSFSKYVYDLHEHINNMLCKKSGLSFEDVQNRYENFRARCTDKDIKNKLWNKPSNKTRKKEKGCIKPFYGKKSKCVIKIVPQQNKCKSFQMSKMCVRTNPEL